VLSNIFEKYKISQGAFKYFWQAHVDNVGTPEILECPLWNLILVEDVGLHLLPRVEWAVTVWPADYNFVSAVV